MLRVLSFLFGLIARSVRSREVVLRENLALRQQFTVFSLKRPRPRLLYSGYSALLAAF
jgi:hypothetical protein